MQREGTERATRDDEREAEVLPLDRAKWSPADVRGWGWERLTSTYRELDAMHAQLISVLEAEARERHASEFEHWAELMGEEPYPAHDVIFNTQRLALNHQRSMLLTEAVRRLLEDFGVEPGDLTLHLDSMDGDGEAEGSGRGGDPTR